MLRVGLTGNIATGKTTVGEMFVQLGCHLIDSDHITHELFEAGQAVNAAVVQAFGPQVLAPTGAINREVLGGIVFKDPDARAKLNSLVHPAIIQQQRHWLKALEAADPNAIGIVSAALMIEIGTYKNYDKVIVVVCSAEEQRRRLRERSPLSEEQIEARIRAQMPMEEKVKFADYVIDNSGTLEGTRNQVNRIYTDLRQLVLADGQ
jgi:dephospho-CoA kinase